MHKRMQRLMERGGIHFKDDPENPGGGGGLTGEEPTGGEPKVEPKEEPKAEPKEEPKGDEPDVGAELKKVVAESMGRKEKIRELTAEQERLAAEREQAANELATIKAALGDVDLEEVSNLVKSKKEAETKQLEEQGEYKRILEQVKESHKTEKEALTNQVTELQNQVNELLGNIDEMTVGRSFSESEFIGKRSTLPPSIARKEFAGHFEMKDGQLVAYDKPASAAERTPLVDSEGNYKPFEQAIEYLYETHPDSKSLIKSVMKPGSGSKTEDKPAKSEPEQPVRTGLSKIEAALSK